MTMQAAFEALTSEASGWDDTSRALSDAATTVSGLQLSAAQFSFVCFMTGIDDSYAQARQHRRTSSPPARARPPQLADALREVRQRDFESTDQQVVSEVQSVWIPGWEARRMGPEAVDRIMDLPTGGRRRSRRSPTRSTTSCRGCRGLGWVVDKFRTSGPPRWTSSASSGTGEGVHLPTSVRPGTSTRPSRWIELGSPVAARATEADRSQSAVDTEWKGQAADRYAMSLGAQGKALTAVQGKLSSVIGPALGSVSTTLYIFYGAVAVAIVAMIVGIVTATGEAVSILRLPAVPPTVIVAVATAILAPRHGRDEPARCGVRCQHRVLKVANETGDFGTDNWPRAVVG